MTSFDLAPWVVGARFAYYKETIFFFIIFSEDAHPLLKTLALDSNVMSFLFSLSFFSFLSLLFFPTVLIHYSAGYINLVHSCQYTPNFRKKVLVPCFMSFF